MRRARGLIASGSYPSSLPAPVGPSSGAAAAAATISQQSCKTTSGPGSLNQYVVVAPGGQLLGANGASTWYTAPTSCIDGRAPAFPAPCLSASAACSVIRPSALCIVRGFAASALKGQADGGEPDAEVADAAEAARRVLADPMSRIMASQGMPVGLSLDRNTPGPISGSSRPNRAAQDEDGESEEEDLSRPPRAEPGYQMEAFQDMLRATAAAARRGGSPDGSGGSGGAEAVSGSGEAEGGFTAGVQRVGPSLEDSWGTTRESPADIARRIVESNAELERARSAGGGAAEDVEDDDGGDAPMTLSPSEQKYASLEAMSHDIKRLDEVFEVLASVPWLDEDVLAEKELKGVAQVGLLGTLEEVGFNIRDELLRIWSGDRGADLAAGPGLEFRDQAALMAILYHTQQIEDAHGPPPRGYLPRLQQDEAGKQTDKE